MYAVEFNTKINNGKIDIPKQYHSDFDSDVKVILFRLNANDVPPSKETEKKELKAFGALSHKANPQLWEQEDSAMESALVKNYEADRYQYNS